jgi:hypothetical protein
VKPSDHVELVSALCIVWGGLTVIIGLSTLALGAGAVALTLTAEAGSSEVAAGLTAAVFVGLAVIALLWGAAHVAVGRGLRQEQVRARHAAIMLAVVDLLILPYGTALGAYALWVLLGESRRRQFMGHTSNGEGRTQIEG